MSITTPANPTDAVRLVGGRRRALGRHRHGRAAQGRALRLLSTAPGSSSTASSPACSCRPTATPARWTPSRRRDAGTTSSTTSTSRAGSYLYEPANSVHTLHVPEDNTEDTDVCFIIEGALLNLAEDGSVESVSDGPGHARGVLRAARGPGRPAAERPHRLSVGTGQESDREGATPTAPGVRRRCRPPHRPDAVRGRRPLRALRRAPTNARPCAGSTGRAAASGPSRRIPRCRPSEPTRSGSARHGAS